MAMPASSSSSSSEPSPLLDFLPLLPPSPINITHHSSPSDFFEFESSSSSPQISPKSVFDFGAPSAEPPCGGGDPVSAASASPSCRRRPPHQLLLPLQTADADFDGSFSASDSSGSRSRSNPATNLCSARAQPHKEGKMVAPPPPPTSGRARILAMAQRRHSVFCDPLLMKAFEVSSRACAAECMERSVGAAMVVAVAGGSRDVVAASLLQAGLPSPPRAADYLFLHFEFGPQVADLVRGVSELTTLNQLLHDNDSSASGFLEADHLLMTLLTMVDVRVIFVKLAERLHTMRTLSLLPAAQQELHREIAKETLGIFAPLASRLGIWTWEVELEELSFMLLYPDEHKRIRDELSENSRGLYVASALKKLDDTLRKAEISFDDLSGRCKSLYSIYTKMSRKSRPLKEIFDVRGLRLIVRDVRSCFLVLDVVHQLWPLIPAKQKDYINHPKHNGYQSLHTVVRGEDGLPLEVQIRTVEMHHNAEFGMAAHWRYKQGGTNFSSCLARRIESARCELSWQTVLVDAKLRVSPSGVDMKPPPCHLPSHLASHGKDLLLCDISMGDQKMAVEEPPLSSTAHDILERVRLAADESNLGLNCWKDVQVEASHRATVHDLHLDDEHCFAEDMVEFKPLYRKCIYGET